MKQTKQFFHTKNPNPPKWRISGKVLFLLMCFWLVVPRVEGQTPEMVKDINPTPDWQFVAHPFSGILPVPVETNAGELIFPINDRVNGLELWKTDGTEVGTVMLKDIAPGIANSWAGISDNLVKMGNDIFFPAQNGSNSGYALWKTDGTSAGTVQLKTTSAYPLELTVADGVLYFFVRTGSNTQQLWKSDGTSSGTVLVKTIPRDNLTTVGNRIVNIGSTIYFMAGNYNSTEGRELWKSDGTSAGTHIVKDITSHPNSSSSFNQFRNSTPLWLTVVGTEIYFVAHDHVLNPTEPVLFFPIDQGYSLWKTDGTEAGTVRVKKGVDGSLFINSLENLIELNGTLYFSGYFDNSGGSEKELWKSDGTLAGTTQVKDISPNNSSQPSDFFTFNNELYFAAEDGANGYKLWKSDGTSGGTNVLKDIDIRGISTSEPVKLLETGASLYFSNRNDLFITDGTSTGTRQLRNPSLGAVYGTIGTKIYELVEQSQLVNLPGVGNVREWRIQEFKNNSPFPSQRRLTFADGISINSRVTKVGTDLYFFANNGTDGEELWKSDGTEISTILIKNITAGADWTSANFGRGVGLGSNFYFSVNNDSKTELWKTDGTEAGTISVKVINPSGDNRIYDFFATDNLTYFVADGGTTGRELWKSDGTTAGTVIVKDINAGSTGSFPSIFAAVGNTLFFVANDGNGNELWKSDGTSAGTVMVKDINPSGASNPTNLINIGGVLYFVANDGNGNENELWKSDGTSAGTVMVKDINPSGASNPNFLVEMGGKLYFKANDGSTGDELWTSDGTNAGTQIVKDIRVGSISSMSSSTTIKAGTSILYFIARDDSGINKFWKSDGTEAGTIVVADINFSSNLNSAITMGNDIFISYDDSFSGGLYGRELWKSDGTNAGTTIVADLNPGGGTSGSSNPGNFTVVGSTLYFTADDGTNGRELWKYQNTSITTTPIASTTYCPGASLDVAFTSSGTFNAGNIFTAELSDATGSFTSPTAIGTLTLDGSNPSGTINATIPLSATNGTGYRIRVVSNDPALVGTDNGSNLTINSDITPVCQNMTVQLDASGNVSITPDQVDNGSTATCGIASLALDKTSFTCADIGANTVTLTVTDASGNTDDCMATVTVEDNIAPTAVCQNISVNLDASGNATITAADIDNGSSDNCGTVNLSLSQTAFTCADIGANTVTLTVNDGNGNSNTCTATVTVEDNIAPTAVCQNITVELDASGNASITAADIDNGSTDNCGTVSLSLSQTAFTCANIGANTVTLTVNDGNGNSNTCTATVTVEDNINPTAVCQNISVNLDASGNASITAADIDNGSSDNCGTVNLSLSQTAFTCADIGANTVTLTVNDGNGNSNTCTATVTVEDNINPVIAGCPSNITLNNDAGTCSALATWTTPTASDNCGIASLTSTHNSGDTFPLGTTTVTYTATDNNGRTATCSFTVTVNDNEAPSVAACPSDISQNNDLGVNGAVVNFTVPTGTDNCSAVTVSQTAGLASGATFPLGSTTVTFELEDAAGNTSTCSFIVTVNYVNVAPSFTASSVSSDEDAGSQSIANWSSFDAGPDNEDASQAVAEYIVQNIEDPSLFSVLPSIDANGTLSYETAPDAFGSSTFEVAVRDNGGTANGGEDTSPFQTFTITISAVNDAPVLVLNEGILAAPADEHPITNSLLQANDVDDENATLIYSLSNAPSAGSLRRSGTTLNTGDTFTQADIDNNRLSYVANIAGDNVSDDFRFVVKDDEDASSPEATFNIVIDVANELSRANISGLNIFPNPSTDGRFKLEIDNGYQGKLQLSIFDAQGKAIWQAEREKTQSLFEDYLQLSRLAKGTYLLKIYQSDNKQITKRLVIQ